MNLRSLIVVMFFLLPSASAFSQYAGFDTELRELHQLEGEDFRERILQLYDSLKTVSDYQDRIQLADQLFKLTSEKDEIAHIRSLLFRASLSEQHSSSLFSQAYKLAEKYKRTDYINNVEHNRALYFMNKHQYDSATVYILRYRKKVKPDTKGEGGREINNLLGDIYFHAGIFEKARNVYNELLREYEEEENWNYFRPYVMMNNLGEISLKTGETDNAKDWFIRSLTKAEEHLNTSYRYNTIAYTKIKLAETYLLNNSIKEADQLLQEVANYPESDIYEDVKQEWIFCKARLLLKQEKATEAKNLAEQLVPGGTHLYSEYRFVPEVYHLLADIYFDLGLYSIAMNHNRQFDTLEDSIQESEHLASSMIIIAEYNEELAKQKLEQTRQKTGFVIKGFVILVIVLIVILLLYYRLYKSKLELVKKALENNKEQELPATEIINNKTDLQQEELIQQKALIAELKNWMETKKPYLDCGLNITEVALHLKTNRTYLSRAINSQLNTSFPNFINEYRIKEAISLIRSGFTQEYTQEALAKKSGFAGRNVFISAFKKYTGVVPSFFIANYHKWDSQKERFVKD